jgi:creatinine deaminase
MTSASQTIHEKFLESAIEEARTGRAEGGIPIGSVLVIDGQVVGRGRNRRVQDGSAILHGEMDCLNNAGRLTAAGYRRSVIYTTLSPCAMCTGAILLFQIPTVVIGENRTFMGREDLLRTAGVDVVVLDNDTCVTLMMEFIRDHPALWNEDIGR